MGDVPESTNAADRQEAAWLFSQNLAVYTGQWVAVLHRKIVAHGPELRPVYEAANKKAATAGGRPFFYAVPSGILAGP